VHTLAISGQLDFPHAAMERLAHTIGAPDAAR